MPPPERPPGVLLLSMFQLELTYNLNRTSALLTALPPTALSARPHLYCTAFIPLPDQSRLFISCIVSHNETTSASTHGRQALGHLLC